jgi:hypothetical protein
MFIPFPLNMENNPAMFQSAPTSWLIDRPNQGTATRMKSSSHQGSPQQIPIYVSKDFFSSVTSRHLGADFSTIVFFKNTEYHLYDILGFGLEKKMFV